MCPIGLTEKTLRPSLCHTRLNDIVLCSGSCGVVHLSQNTTQYSNGGPPTTRNVHVWTNSLWEFIPFTSTVASEKVFPSVGYARTLINVHCSIHSTSNNQCLYRKICRTTNDNEELFGPISDNLLTLRCSSKNSEPLSFSEFHQGKLQTVLELISQVNILLFNYNFVTVKQR